MSEHASSTQFSHVM